VRLAGGLLFLALLAPLGAAEAQQAAMPVIGYIGSASPDVFASRLSAFRQGLGETGYVEGRNVAIEYRWAEGRSGRLPDMVADLLQRRVTMIAATTTPAALAAKAATTTMPIVFETGGDPIRLGLVGSLRRPGANITGVTQLNTEVTAKRLELVHELIPNGSIALLLNPNSPELAEFVLRAARAAAQTLGRELHVLKASADGEFDGIFAEMLRLRAGALMVGADAFFTSRQEQLAALAVRHAVPTIYENRAFAAAGGLASYGGSITDAYRLTGVYAGRLLKGEKPGELPVQQATKVEMFLNLKTAKALGITVPLPLLGRADEVFE